MNRKLLKGLIALIAAILAIFARPGAPDFVGWGLVLTIVRGLVYFAVVWFAFPKIDGRKLKYTIPLGGFFGLCTAFGAEYFTKDLLDLSLFGWAEKLFTAFGLGVIYTAAAVLIFSISPMGTGSRIAGRRAFFIAWGTIVLCWLPCYIAYYPGIFSYDIPTQLIGISEGSLTTDHPLLHTLLAWGCFSLGKAISSYTLGGAIYSMVQLLALSASFAGVVAYLRRPILRWGSLAWFALIPIHPLFAVNATKDVLFAACTIVFLLLLAELIHRPERLERPLYWVAFAFAVAVMALMRNTGIYVFAVFIPLLVWACPKRRWKALALCAVCLVLFFGSRSGLNAALQVQEGRFTETLSVPLQQIARCAKSGVLTQEELQEVERYLPEEVWQSYHPRLADEVKNNADRAAIQQDTGGLIRLWLRLLVQHPRLYVEAFMGMNVGYWYPEAEYPDPMIWHRYIETGIKDLGKMAVWDQNFWPPVRTFYNNIALGKAEGLVPLDLLMKPGLYCWLTICLLALALYRRDKRAGLVLGFLAVSWVLQLLSPIALLRYAYPFMTAIPLALGCSFKENE